MEAILGVHFFVFQNVHIGIKLPYHSFYIYHITNKLNSSVLEAIKSKNRKPNLPLNYL